MFSDLTHQKGVVQCQNRLPRNEQIRTADNINGFLFALPWIIGFVCFSLIPLLNLVYYSFTSFNPVKPPEWIGLENFKYIFKDR